VSRAPAAENVRGAAGRLARAVFGTLAVAGVGVGLFAGGKVGYRWLTTSPTFAIHRIELRGNRRASADALVRRSGLSVGHNLFTSDVDAAERGIAQEPWVKTVDVHRRLPDTVSIRVTERAPVVLVDLGKLYFADADGALFKRAHAGDDLDLPVVSGIGRDTFQSQPKVVEAQLRDLEALLADYQARGFDKAYRVQELSLDAARSVSLVLSPVGRRGAVQTVALGEAPFGPKLDKLGTLWGELRRRGMTAQVIHLENRTRPNWVAVKLALADPSTHSK